MTSVERGRVISINPDRGMIAVEVEGAGITVLEVLGEVDVELGDEIVGALSSLGGETLWHPRSKDHFEAFVEATDATRGHAQQLLWPR